ncbi:ABC transporter substrate-binding protein [Paracidovorax wautersii]|uniref:Polar amino acid transport system substrate-binding protein n=1 Tax=Paracidovorax wautersii TaxID=1177982 RepID=A0ABU1IDC3_9BURK|nr:ABC transporter substrate-binding protein [Paracidovorax wautersii]MDR6215230.1 polar amino acid transport system substrate-binding protein [Paracidovorax wautersii]
MPVTPDLLTTLAPTGRIRAAINTGNPILARREADGRPAGVSVDLAHRFAERLGLPLELAVFDTAAQSVEAVTREEADFGFFAIDPVRGAGIAFSAPYVLIEGSYLVAAGSPLTDNAQVDQPGCTVVVGQGSAYDLFLSRTLAHAQIVRAPSSPAVVETFLATGSDVAAGVRQQLEADAAQRADLRLLPGRFMVIEQAMGLPRPRSQAAQRLLADFVEEAKASGFVAQALQRHGIQGAVVAPAGGA